MRVYIYIQDNYAHNFVIDDDNNNNIGDEQRCQVIN